MFSHIARQQIYNSNLECVAYELLFRGSEDNEYPVGTEADHATSRVLLDALLYTTHEKSISDNKPCFVNFSQHSLLKGLPILTPNQKIVIEVLEDCEPTPALFNSLKMLKEKGYSIALDDLMPDESWVPFFEICDIVKVDMDMLVQPKHQKFLTKYRAEYGFALLAEKVETFEHFQLANHLQCDLLQGYYFQYPEVIRFPTTYVLASTKSMMEELDVDGDLSAKTILVLLQKDITLAYQLLVYINYLYPRQLNRTHSLEALVDIVPIEALQNFLITAIRAGTPLESTDELKWGRHYHLLALKLGACPHCAFLASLFAHHNRHFKTELKTLLRRFSLSGKVKSTLLGLHDQIAIELESSTHFVNGATSAAQRQTKLSSDKIAHLRQESLK